MLFCYNFLNISDKTSGIVEFENKSQNNLIWLIRAVNEANILINNS